MKRFLRGIAWALFALSIGNLTLSTTAFPPFERRMKAVPRLVLWAWERPEDLRFLDPQPVAVAFLAGTVELRHAEMGFRPRLQPLHVSRRMKLLAVVRVEVTANALLDQSQAAKAADAIARASELPQVIAVQVDFDATRSQRGFYRELLTKLRRQLPSSMPISITALSSWCIGDRWIGGLPIDEAVPMLFRMGVGQPDVSNWLRAGRDFREPACRASLGVSLDEPWTSLPSGRRVYAFSPSPWTQQSFQTLAWELHSWR